MDAGSLTDELIDYLLTVPKRIKNPKAREVPKAKHKERNYEVESTDGSAQFILISRQSTIIVDNFSCGLIWQPSPGQKVILTRYNGFDHVHANPIEQESFEYECHIHRATQRYIQAGRKAEMYAEATSRYRNLSDALKCLTEDCNIQGLKGSSLPGDAQSQLSFDGNDD